MASHVSIEPGAASYFLPGEIVKILSKVTDLKTLCICKRVSRRFNQIICQVDTISFNAPSSWKTNKGRFREHLYILKDPCKNYLRSQFGHRFDCVIYSMTKFTRLKSLYIKLPSVSSYRDFPLLKWKVLTSNRIDSFVFLSPTSIHDTKGLSYVNGNDDHEKENLYFPKYMDYDLKQVISKCLDDAIWRYMMLSAFTIGFPLLEKISITDSCKKGRVSPSGAKIAEVMESFNYPRETLEKKLMHSRILTKNSMCYIPFLELPVSGFVMKGVTLVLKERTDLPCGYSYDRLINVDDEDEFEDKEEAAYSEAVMEIFKNHRDRIYRA